MGLSNIQWCDYTFNPWIGCRKVAPECANCYAETLDRNRYSKTLRPGTKEQPVSHWGSGPRHRTQTWGDPLKWNITQYGAAPNKLHRPRVFCASLADWLDDENVPIEWTAELFDLMRRTPNLDWLALTKRPANWAQRIEAVLKMVEASTEWNEAVVESPLVALRNWLADWFVLRKPPANIWIGVSAGADQAAALDIPARVHFLSSEPMLRPLDTTHAARFDWIIFGGESGNLKAKDPKKRPRPCHIEWLREGVKFSRDHSVATFVKQMGSNCIETRDVVGATVHDRIPIKDSHGGDITEWPEDLRVREFPTGGAR